jgi:hypothetical protein
MYQFRDVFIYMTILIAGYTFVGVWLDAITSKHKLFPWGGPKEDIEKINETPHWFDTFFTGGAFFIIGFFMASFEWITK